MNGHICKLSKKHINLIMMDHTDFCDRNGILKPEFGRYKDQLPNRDDLVHLDRNGLMMLAVSIKSCVMSRGTPRNINVFNGDYAAAVKNIGNVNHNDY